MQDLEINFMDWSILLKTSLDEFKTRRRQTEFKEFENLNTNYDRVGYLIDRNGLQIEDYVKNIATSDEEHKSEVLSEKYRKQGNEHFCKKDYRTALEFYTLAITYAPKSSNALTLAFSNRSAIFYDLKRFEQCLLDLDRVKCLLSPKTSPIKDRQMSDLIVKLLTRQVNCLAELKKPADLEKDEFVKLLRTGCCEDMNQVEAKIATLKNLIRDKCTKAKPENKPNDDTDKHEEVCLCLIYFYTLIIYYYYQYCYLEIDIFLNK